METKPFLTDFYDGQMMHWPWQGRHILAQYDETSVVVYQAYRPAIARYAVAEQHFGGEFSFSRMSWIKPNFLWMMYRCGWATKLDQERVLAVRLSRPGFDEILRAAVPSSFDAARFASPQQWQAAVDASTVRLQWDPDHDPSGQPLRRRAIQLGLRGATLARYAREWIVDIRDITDFVAAGRAQLAAQDGLLVVAKEAVYVPADPHLALQLGLDPPGRPA